MCRSHRNCLSHLPQKSFHLKYLLPMSRPSTALLQVILHLDASAGHPSTTRDGVPCKHDQRPRATVSNLLREVKRSNVAQHPADLCCCHTARFGQAVTPPFICYTRYPAYKCQSANANHLHNSLIHCLPEYTHTMPGCKYVLVASAAVMARQGTHGLLRMSSY